ncbi:TfoX N-terminal domain-containing protein [Albimonas donghaensis]|uniref:TfoX N-terminal domain-containing protein n=1 Tax=Albimonas donghaensis TaxID=356660 RepID=A0A1H3F112_9RHOB|nr:TfoX/Sxy family protein [Albimonas donghaensis]SDX84712.1 TfoX N-terminal domain-containing protein [Albimonas donghaensis]
MAHDPAVLAALRAALGEADLEVMEKRMFGGCCLMWRGHMLAVARGDRGGHGAFARVGAQAMPRALALPGAAPMVMRGRPTADFVHVPRETALDPAHAGALIGMALDFVGRLPAK